MEQHYKIAIDALEREEMRIMKRMNELRADKEDYADYPARMKANQLKLNDVRSSMQYFKKMLHDIK
jgi:demethoxyubiquinone hydroxylase (CLK1/Coq7/Cat5 family)